MARPRNFAEERALDAAMHTFWEKGFEATSTQDLCEATGLGRNSVHDTFKGTRDPFERAPARYIDTMTAARLAVLEDVRLSGAERIRALLAMISSTARPNTARAAAAPVSDREHHGRTRRPRPAGGADA